MTVKECYDAMGADYADVTSRLRTDERITKFLFRILQDGSFGLLCESLAQKNLEEAFRAAHTLKGVCMNLSLRTLGASASQLTEALRGRTTYGDDIEPLLARVKEDYEHTMDCIRTLQQTSETI